MVVSLHFLSFCFICLIIKRTEKELIVPTANSEDATQGGKWFWKGGKGGTASRNDSPNRKIEGLIVGGGNAVKVLTCSVCKT